MRCLVVIVALLATASVASAAVFDNAVVCGDDGVSAGSDCNSVPHSTPAQLPHQCFTCPCMLTPLAAQPVALPLRLSLRLPSFVVVSPSFEGIAAPAPLTPPPNRA